MDAPTLSFVVPLKNEQETLAELLARIEATTSGLGHSYEVIFVDDGSDDQSWRVIRVLSESREGRVRGIRFRRNLGKAAALSAGFRAARGQVVFTLDADLQDDPQEIGRFLAKLGEGFDIVSGWKRVRHDPWHKVLPSRVFNAMLSAMSSTPLHDHNCGFKCYRARVVKELVLYGEMHRMIPALSSIRGFRSAEIEVTHHARMYGQSKYGVKRFLRGFMDMLTVSFLQSYRDRPLHFLGGMALAIAAVGVTTFSAGIFAFAHTGATAPLEIAGASLVAGSVPLLGLGFLSELLIHVVPALRPPLPVAEEVPSRSDLAVASSRSIDTSSSGPSSVREISVPRSLAANDAVS